jgi:glyoxylate reductase
MTPSILVTRRPPGQALDIIGRAGRIELWSGDETMPRAELVTRAASVDALYCMLTDRIDAALLDAAPRLRVVSNMAVGLDNIDLDECTERGIAVGHTPGVLTGATADLAMALLLAAARRVGEGIDYVRSGSWGEFRLDLLLGHEVHSSVLGIVGMGRIGASVARRAVGFGMSIVYSGPNRKPDIERELGAAHTSFDRLLQTADHVVITAPLTPETHHLINRESLRLMKPTATLVNVARGPLVDTDALVEALERGRIAAAALDVTDPEPLPADHPLVTLRNCVVIPHLGSATLATRAAMADLAARNLVLGLAGEELEACANPEVYR